MSNSKTPASPRSLKRLVIQRIVTRPPVMNTRGFYERGPQVVELRKVELLMTEGRWSWVRRKGCAPYTCTTAELVLANQDARNGLKSTGRFMIDSKILENFSKITI